MLFRLLSLVCCCFTAPQVVLEEPDTSSPASKPPPLRAIVDTFLVEVRKLGNITPEKTKTKKERFAFPYMAVKNLLYYVANLDTLGELGEGASGSVRRRGPTALKRIAFEAIDDVAGEIWCMTQMNHPNLMQAIDHFAMNNVMHIFMPVSVRWEYRFVDYKLAYEGLLGAVRGLHALHSLFIVHGDFKPDNILMQGRVGVLSDFGLSTRATERNEWREGNAYTPGFMAPEVEDQGFYAEPSDIYALGRTLEVYLDSSLKVSFPFLEQMVRLFVEEEFEDRPTIEEILPHMENVSFD